MDERVTVLEHVEFKVLLDAIRQSMIDSEVSPKDDFKELDASLNNAMETVSRAALNRLVREVEDKVSAPVAARVRHEFASVILKDYYVE